MSLTSITSLTGGDELSCLGRGRHWRLPSLERVQTDGTVWPKVLGELVCTSRSLKELHVECDTDVMADSLRFIPVAAAGQPGPLAQLEDIGTLRMLSGSAEDLTRLQAVLVDRGCRSIKKLSVKVQFHLIDSRIFETLLAIETFTRAVCVRPDIPVGIKAGIDSFDLGLLGDVPTLPAPSFFVQKQIQQLAAASQVAYFTIRPRHLTAPLHAPSTAASVLAQCLTFPNAKGVTVTAPHDLEPAADAELDPVVLESMPHNAFPAASRLRSHSSKGCAISRRLLAKMPVVKSIDLWGTCPTHADAVGVVQAVGGERDLDYFDAGRVTGVGEGGLSWGDIADQLPTIKRLVIAVKVPQDLGDGDGGAAGEFSIACIKSLLKIRGLKRLQFALWPAGEHSFKRLVEERTHGDTIEGLDGRFDVEWGRGEQWDRLTLKPLDT
ncbi:unnamed protein product [Vitrella brassicaformis CCMP3155]|uniref:Uncharacterized protein n=1 Tax=Vitrella brassicaformis (strain CCMP3155) TaxID=1169540 RepID=A0A0G4H4N4_VITBC|nr:unnamed protein product [Vitrella brassicaformis CCMP3155]|eukprot:CEM38506.1 unnamed protein product [Vitrella brassicaformis CCMP3155]